MDKRHAHHFFRRLQGFRTSYFVVAVVLVGLLFVMAYRQNNVQALRLRDAVIAADEQNGDVESALRELRVYTYGHMNANLSGGANNIYPPIQLKYRYERLVKAEKDRVTAVNAKLYTDAQNYCEQQVTSRTTINRVPCIQDYLASHGAATERPIPDALYKFDFAAPIWSPDLAGWSLVAFVVLLLALIARVVAEWWLRYQLGE
jgi:hypothetical protein